MKKIKTVLLYAAVIASAIWILATPFIYIQAAKDRMLPGIGGEFFWPFFPILLWQIGITVRDTLRAEKEAAER